MAGRKSRYSSDDISTSISKKWKIAKYIRLSVEDGDDKVESNSITNQRQLLNAYIKNNVELELYDYYIDDRIFWNRF